MDTINYEYIFFVIPISRPQSFDDFTDKANKLGAMGWRMTHVIHDTSGLSYYYFERKL